METTNQFETINICKEMIDHAYETTKNKYGQTHAIHAIISFFMNHTASEITNDKKDRDNLKYLLYREGELYQILFDYAISSYIINNVEANISMDKLRSYTNTNDETLDYSPETATKITALAAGLNTYWAINLLSCNRRLKSALLQNFIIEKYVLNKKELLNSSKNTKRVILTSKEEIFLSKHKLNRDVENMNNDDEKEEFNPPKR